MENGGFEIVGLERVSVTEQTTSMHENKLVKMLSLGIKVVAP